MISVDKCQVGKMRSHPTFTYIVMGSELAFPLRIEFLGDDRHFYENINSLLCRD